MFKCDFVITDCGEIKVFNYISSSFNEYRILIILSQTTKKRQFFYLIVVANE